MKALSTRDLAAVAQADLSFLAESSPDHPLRELRKLQLILDLLDRARFGRDAQAKQKALMALGLQQEPGSSGVSQWRDASSKLLARAIDLEARLERNDASEASADPSNKALSLDEASLQSLADLIMLLSVDVHPPHDRSEVENAALAIYELGQRGHPDLQDNARWRHYDYLRALLLRISEATPRQGVKLSWFSELGPTESLDTKQSGPDQVPRYPTGPALVDGFLATLAALSEDPRWQQSAQSLEAPSQALIQRALRVLPETRRADWKLPTTRPDFAYLDPWSTLVVANPGAVSLAGESFRIEQHQRWVKRLRDRLVLVSQPDVLLAAEEQLPAPDLHALFLGLHKAGIHNLHLAAYNVQRDLESEKARVSAPLFDAETLRGPKTPSKQKPQVPRTQQFHATVWSLPLRIVDSELSSQNPPSHSQSAADWQLDLFLFANTTRLGWNQSLHPKVFEQRLPLVATIRDWLFAYPNASAIRLHVAPDLNYQQLFSLIRELQSITPASLPIELAIPARSQLFPVSKGLPSTLAQRTQWRFPAGSALPNPEVQIEGAHQDSEDAHAGVFAFAQRAFLCLPELQDARAKRKIDLEFNFIDGLLGESQMRRQSANLPILTRKRLQSCIRKLGQSFHLSKPLTLRARVSLPLPTPRPTGARPPKKPQ